MIELTFDKAVQYLKEAVELKGEDHVYEQVPVTWAGDDADELTGPSCVYAKDGQPDCIVGHVFAKAGVPIEDMTWVYGAKQESSRQTKYSHGDAFEVLDRLEFHGVLKADGNTKRLLTIVQREQDDGTPWGEALDFALSDLKSE